MAANVFIAAIALGCGLLAGNRFHVYALLPLALAAFILAGACGKTPVAASANGILAITLMQIGFLFAARRRAAAGAPNSPN